VVALRQRNIGRLVARTAGYNVASVVAAGLGGVIVARALGPELRGEYAAVTAWAGVALMIGEMGQPAAACFFVAHDPDHARDYVAASRALMLTTGTVMLVGGILLAPILGRGNGGLIVAYRIAFATMIVPLAGTSYMFALQARDLGLWNTVRTIQPILSLACLVMLWRLRLLTLNAALVVTALTVLGQLGWAYYRCRSTGLAPGRARVAFVRPLVRYGVAQISALTPATLNAYLDQLVLSQVVPAAVLGRYAIAVTCTLLPMPVVSAIGNVAFPRLASRQHVGSMVRRMQWLGILAGGCTAVAALVPLDLAAPWLIPHVFGPAYTDMAPLLWALTPAGVFLACNQVIGDMLRGRRHPLAVARAEGLAAIFTVILLVILLPAVGVYGAAIASAVAYGVALVMMLLSLRSLPSNNFEPGHRKRPANSASHRGAQLCPRRASGNPA
jgi:O-antigen/teichoic acid export membrane protein